VIRYTNIEETTNIQTGNFWGKLDENHPSIHYCLQKLTSNEKIMVLHMISAHNSEFLLNG
jgi:hypothetical protein